MQRTIEIPGDVVAKKNSQRIVKFGSRASIRPSKAFDKYAKSVIPALSLLQPWEGSYPVTVTTYFYRSTRRKFDLDNMHSSILDCLVKAEILEDDCMTHVIPRIYRHGWSLDKNNPRTIVWINEYQPTEAHHEPTSKQSSIFP